MTLSSTDLGFNTMAGNPLEAAFVGIAEIPSGRYPNRPFIGSLVEVAVAAVRDAGMQISDIDTVAGAADDLRLTDVVEAVTRAGAADPPGTSTAVPVGKGAQLVRFHKSVRGLADPTQLCDATSLLLEASRGAGGLTERELATAVRHTSGLMREDRLVEHDADLRRAHRSFVKTRGPVGLSRYTLLLDEEGYLFLRDRKTGPRDFKQLLGEMAGLMAYEVTKALPLAPVEVVTPLERMEGMQLAQPVVLVPILRAGLGMVDGIQQLIPTARVGHIGLYRDEATLQPVHYYLKLPPVQRGSEYLVLDPMLATGGSAVAAVTAVKEAGAAQVRLLSIVAAPEGVRALAEAHPDVPVHAAALDRGLNDRGYILPGLGDAGDRLYGTR